jgi:hypothetical protein
MQLRNLAAAAMLAVLAPLQAAAQTGDAAAVWTSADGALRFKSPAGWERRELPSGDEAVFLLAKGKRGSGSPALTCKLTLKLLGPAAPGLTQDGMNARLQAGAASITLDEKRIATNGGLTTIDGFLAMEPRILMVLKAFYVSGGNLHDAYMECGSHNPGELTMADLAAARELFDTISVKQ